MSKNPKLQHVPKVFPLGGTTSYPTTKCSASKGKCVGTGCNFGSFFKHEIMNDESTDESGLETSVSDLQFSLDDKVNLELFQKLIQLLPANSELNPEMFSPDELRSCAGKQDVISDHMYSLHLAYLIWKQSRKANERILEVIQLSVENIRPKSRENRKI